MEALINKEERIEIRVSSRDKQIFRKAQKLSGDKTFSSFITRVVRAQAECIITESEKILASEQDRKLFFDSIFENQEPNENLVAAARRYKSKISFK
jgi:uncharacterized protein (DUF1778 family)